MYILRHPVPMLAPSGWGASVSSGLPANVHLKAKLESLDSSCRPLECYEAASIFLLHKVVSFEGAAERHHRKYSVYLERILNWSFIVAHKPVFDWDGGDIQRYLEFVENPDSSWVSSSTFSRFISNQEEPFERWLINERWRPFKREFFNGVPRPPYWGAIDKERTIVLDFFLFLSQRTSYSLAHLSADIVEKLRRIIPTKRPPRSLRRQHSEQLFKINSFELDWLFEKANELRKGNWRYELVLFAMAVMRYSSMPIKSLCCGPGFAGLLSQFYRCNDKWYFVSDSGAPTKRIYELDAQINSYIREYLSYLEVTEDQPLPDSHIFRRLGYDQGFGYGYVAEFMRGFRRELCESVETNGGIDTPVKLEVVRKITLQLIRKSSPLPSPEMKRCKRPPKS
jgi:hypothetical protein